MKPNNLISVIAGWLGLLVAPAPAVHGSEPTGNHVLSGRVVNQATGQYLEGAQVQSVSSGRVALTSRLGYFELGGLPPGPVQLTVTYAGLDPQTIRATIAGPRTEVGEVALTAGVYRLDAFVVPGEREGNALAITQQRNAPNLKNVLSSDAFGNVADENIGNFIQRVPGVVGVVEEGQIVYVRIRGIGADLNSVTVDGTRAASGGIRAGLDRNFEISSIPADFVDKVEVIKAPTPDMDADSIGGSVNLKTKSALHHKGRLFTYKLGTSYATDRKTFRPMGSLMYSNVLGKDRNLGVMVTASYSWATNARDVNIGAWQPTLITDRPAYFTLTAAGEDHFEFRRGGLGVRFDYKINDRSVVFLNVMYSKNYDNMHRRRNTFSGANDSRILPGWNGTVVETRDLTYGLQQTHTWRGLDTYNIHLGGEQRFNSAKLDYKITYSPSQGYERRHNITPQVTGVGFRFDQTGLSDDPALATFRQISGPSITNVANMTLPSLGFTDVTKEDRVISGHADLRKTIGLQDQNYLQTGFRFRMQNPETISRPVTYSYIGPGGANLARFVDESYTYQPKALRDTMPDVRFFHVPTIVEEWRTNPQFFRIDQVVQLRQRLVSDRHASEAVYAAYVSGNVRFGDLSILAGLRVEETRVEGTGTFQFLSSAEKARRAAWVGPVTLEENLRRTGAEYGNRVSNEARYRNLFPGLHLRYQFRSGLLARFSYSTGIGRPSFGTIIPNNSVSEATQTVTVNNTGLKPQEADNIDISLEYYLSGAGVVSAGVFQKKISDFIFPSDLGFVGNGIENGFNGEFEGYLLRSQSNGGSARVRGFEASYQQQFSNLPGFWRGFGFYANGTWLETEGNYGSTAGTLPQVPGFVNRSGNLGLSYIDRGWTIRVQENFTGRSMGNINANPALQLFNYGKRKLDVSFSYTITPRWTVFADVINVLGDEIGLHPYIYIPGRPRGSDTFSPEIKAGLSGRF